MRATIKVSDISCTMCAKTIEKHFNAKEGISAKVLVTDKKVIFDYDKTYTLDDVYLELRALGFNPIVSDSDEKKKKIFNIVDLVVSTVFTLPLLWPMFEHLGIPIWVPHILMDGWVQLALTIPVQFFVGRRFFKAAFNQLKHKSIGMDVLIVIGTLSAFIYSLYLTIINQINPVDGHIHLYFEVSAVIIWMVLIGNLFEDRVKKRATLELQAIVNLSAKEARVLANGKQTLTPVSNVKVGDVVVVLPHERIPVDGSIILGQTYVDESTLTGESIPSYKVIGDPVLALTLNTSETIHIRVTKIGADTVQGQIIKAVEDAASFKPKIQRLADKIATYFVPAVVLIAIITFIIQISVRQDMSFAFRAAIAVLVISCPCALGLATPTSVAVASGIAFKSGFVYKGGEFFETAHKINIIAFDKTGTLTQNKPSVVSFIGDEDSFVYTKSLEMHSNHPLANAVLDYKDIKPYDVDEFLVLPGIGIKGVINKKEVIVGSSRIIENFDEKHKYYLDFINATNEGKTVIFTMINNQVVNMLCIIDPIRDDSIELIRLLKEKKITPVMITGDQENTAKFIAKQLGIDEVFAEGYPHEKAEIIKTLQAKDKTVGFIGDGINDSAALKIADVGIVVCEAADIAMDFADIVLMRNSLLLVISALNLSRNTNINIYLNFFWAFIYNIVLIPVAALGYVTPQLAGIGMAFSSIMVVLNALSLKLYKGTKLKK